MVDKIINGALIGLCAFIVYLGHTDRMAFLEELDKTRQDYIRTLTIMQSDIKEVKDDVKSIKRIVEKNELAERIKEEVQKNNGTE